MIPDEQVLGIDSQNLLMRVDDSSNLARIKTRDRHKNFLRSQITLPQPLLLKNKGPSRIKNNKRKQTTQKLIKVINYFPRFFGTFIKSEDKNKENKSEHEAD